MPRRHRKSQTRFFSVFDDDIAILQAMTAKVVDGRDSPAPLNLTVTTKELFDIRVSLKKGLTFMDVEDLLNCISIKPAGKR